MATFPKKRACKKILIKVSVLLLVFSFVVEPCMAAADTSQQTPVSFASQEQSLKDSVAKGNSMLKGSEVKAVPDGFDVQKYFAGDSTGGVKNPHESISSDGSSKKQSAQTTKTQSDSQTSSGFQTESMGTPYYGETNKSPSDFSNIQNGVRVNATGGAFQYSYPITVPAGRNGLTPTLNLNYSNQQSDYTSITGQGWSLDIPSIDRDNKRGTDKLFSQQDFTSSLSGELATTSVAGVYVAKSDDGSYLNYTFASSTWTATDKAGTTYKFGYSSATQLNNSASTTQIARWMLEEVRDTNGNYISYSYSKDNNQIYPASIQYVQTGGVPLYSISFSLASSSGARVSNRTGFAVTTAQRISAIFILTSATTTRAYSLTYTKSQKGNIDLLTSIQERGFLNGVEVNTPPTSFTYSETVGSGTWTDSTAWGSAIPYDLETDVMTSVSTTTPYFRRTQLTDVNGDGLADWVVGGAAYLNTGNGWDTNNPWSIPVNAYEGPNRMEDINGDGLPDIVVSTHTIWHPSWSHADDITKQVYLNNGDGTWSQSTTTAATIPVWFETVLVDSSGNRSYYENTTFISDMNGDGLTDIEQGGTVYLNTGSGWNGNVWSGMPTYAFLGPDRLSDVNGDGLPDIIHSTEKIWHPVWNHPTEEDQKVYLNRGDGTWTLDAGWGASVPGVLEQTITNSNSTTNTYEYYATLLDIDGDGLPDWLTNQKAYINTGNGWSTTTAVWSGLSTTAYDGDSRIADINADGVPDIVQAWRKVWYPSYNHADDVTRAAHMNGSQTQWLLTNVTNESGGTTAVTYTHSAIPVSGQKLNPALPYNISIVKNVTYSDPVANSTQSVDYSFAQGTNYYKASDIFDRQFAGFGKVIISDGLRSVTTYYHQGNTTASTTGEYLDSKSKIGKPYRVEIRDTSGNLFETIISKWDEFSRGGQAYFAKLIQTTDELFNGNSDHADKASANTYNNTTGDMTQSVNWGAVTAANDGSFTDIGTDKVINDILYATTSSSTISKPSDETITNQAGTKLSEARHYYDTLSLGSITKGNETKTENWIATSTYVSTQHTYNSNGLVTQDTDPRGQVTSYTYDPYTLYVASSTNALQQTKSYMYNYANGAVQNTYNTNGQLFRTIYDGLGRITAEQQPDPTIASTTVTKDTIAYDYTSGPKITRSDYLNASTPVTLITYLDGFSRKIQERKQAEASGVYMVSDKKYDSNGQLASESLPYFSNGTSRTTATTTSALLKKYTYDALGNIKKLVTADGTTNTTFSGWSTTTVDPLNHSKTYVKDAYGNLIQVKENNSGTTYTTNYSWDGIGNLTNLTDANGNVRNFTYDGMSRQLSAEDLHAASDSTFGIRSYTYDGVGNLTSQTDPKSQTTNFTYDPLNRVLTEDFTRATGVEKGYTYDSCTGGISSLCVASTSASVTSYTYNPLGLISTTTTSITGTSTPFATGNQYDWQGNQTLLTYPDKAQVQYAYNAAGLLESVQEKENGASSFSTIVSNIDYSPRLKPTLTAYGNGSSITNTYNPALLYRLTNILAKNSASTTIQNLSYTYDADGNISQAIDQASSTAPVTISYTYDDLNRLLQANYLTGTTSLAGWYNTSWQYRVPVTASTTKVLEDTKDVYVSTSQLGSGFAANAQANGCDIRVTKGDGSTEVPIDVVGMASTTGQLFFSTGGSLSTSSPSTYYVYYGNPSATCYTPGAQYGARNVYDTNTLGVWHLEENTASVGGVKDSTNNGNNATMYANYSPNANGSGAGLLGQAASFDGVNQSIDVPNNSQFNGTNMTIEGWTYLNTLPSAKGETERLVTKKNSTSPWNSYSAYVSNPANRLDATWNNSAGTTAYAGTYTGSIATSSWFYFTLRHDTSSTTAELSVRGNGSSSGTYTADTDGTVFNSDDVLRFGADYAGGERLQGKMDEVRLHTNALSDNYLTTRYNNFSSPSTFWQVGSSTASGIASTSLYTESYAYDPIGNITSKSNLGTYSYTSGAGYQNPNAPLTIGSTTYSYDNNGNLTSGGALSNQWNYKDQLTQSIAGSVTSGYTYDAQDSRVKQVVGGMTTYVPSRLYTAMDGGAGTTTKQIYAGGVLVATITNPSAAASSTVTASNSIYSDSLASGWNDWSWNSTRNFSNTSPVYSGTNSLAMTYSAAYAGLYLNTTGTSTAGYTHLHLAFNSPTASPYLQVIAYNSSGTPITSAVPFSSYVPGGTISANTWYIIDIPLADLGASATTTTGIVIQKDSAGTEYFDDIRFTAQSASSGSPARYSYPDLLGSTNVIADAGGMPLENLIYTPYGSLKTDSLYAGYGGTQRKYIGEIYDTSTQLNYLNARYYDGARGQFLSQDPVFWSTNQNLDNPQSLNSYSYANNNPITNSDPDGLASNNAATQAQQAAIQRKINDTKAQVQQVWNRTIQAGSGAVLDPVKGFNQARDKSNPTDVRAAALAGTAIGIGATAIDGAETQGVKLLNPGIRTSAERIAHVIEGHTASGIDNAGNSIFHEGENIKDLIQGSTQHPISQQSSNRFERIYNAGRSIGTDTRTGNSTNVVTVITDAQHNLVTAFPGVPRIHW